MKVNFTIILFSFTILILSCPTIIFFQSHPPSKRGEVYLDVLLEQRLLILFYQTNPIGTNFSYVPLKLTNNFHTIISLFL